MKKIVSDLRFWIGMVSVLIISGNIIIKLSVLSPENKFSNHISLTSSLLGGVITLISISVTNGYYNKEKSYREKLDKCEKIKFQLNALKFLKEEFEVNKTKLIEYKHKYNMTNKLTETFQTIVWENTKNIYVEIFIDISEKGLFDIQKFYILINQYKGIIKPIQVSDDSLFELFGPIEVVIDNAINEYEKKLLEFDDIYQRVLKIANYIIESKTTMKKTAKVFEVSKNSIINRKK